LIKIRFFIARGCQPSASSDSKRFFRALLPHNFFGPACLCHEAGTATILNRDQWHAAIGMQYSLNDVHSNGLHTSRSRAIGTFSCAWRRYYSIYSKPHSTQLPALFVFAPQTNCLPAPTSYGKTAEHRTPPNALSETFEKQLKPCEETNKCTP